MLEAERAVKAPVFGVVLPIVPGTAQVPDRRELALFVPLPEKVKLSPDGIVSAVMFGPTVPKTV